MCEFKGSNYLHSWWYVYDGPISDLLSQRSWVAINKCAACGHLNVALIIFLLKSIYWCTHCFWLGPVFILSPCNIMVNDTSRA